MATKYWSQGETRGWKRGNIVLMAFIGIMALAFTFGTLIPPPSTAHAASSEPWLYIECEEGVVKEGDDFRLVVRKKYKDETAPYKKIRVFWYTEPGTADGTDYEHMDGVRQASNGYQSRTGKMGRDFHTREGIFPEVDETYTVRFNNSNDQGTDGRCEITLGDDDGVGIHYLEIRSVPREIRLDDDGKETIDAYTAGDVILVTAHFNHPVTTVNPDTGEQTDYAGLHLNIGENRRVANVVRGDGTDTLIFGYTVQAEDVDANGISVEDGWAGTGLYYNEETSDSGLWPVNPGDGRLNRIFHGLSDDPDHPVAQVDVEEPTITPPIEPPLDDEPSIVEPDTGEWVERAIDIDGNLLTEVNGELTAEDEGRDWYSFEATAGEDYIIELRSQMDIKYSDLGKHLSTLYVDGHLVDPSILEIINAEGEQVMGESDRGGFTSNWARGYFTPQYDGTHYIAVGAGAQDPEGLGFYTLSVRRDDHPDDHRTRPDTVLHPGESITACIDSDVPPDHPDLKPWDWLEYHNTAHPLFGIEPLDDIDVIGFQISEEGAYLLSVSDGPESVGIWALMDVLGNGLFHAETAPEVDVHHYFHPGTYGVAIGTPYESSGNTGEFTVHLIRIQE